MSLGRCLAFMALKCRTLSYDDKKEYAPPLHPLNFARVSFLVTISRRFTCGKNACRILQPSGLNTLFPILFEL